ncbi:Crp/Fnr family transcriptional regulator [Sphingopyxis sp.]|jgi:CRP-like cAMP-binding protein|uniref:Crp/Fnr family transcriptional regulator n=1 Tax=Sphingopyxis sp. TaxID=1908224 RepID=UPI0025EB2E78|nr:Crp/Fnr family transcriptional regulator [Sphingopyxis sp.]MBK6413061.1 Crp/Fnr family transcriptional regulator [Sphingopyxis sp.]
MFTERFLRDKRGASLTADERARIEGAIGEVKTLAPRKIIARAGEPLHQSTLLIEGVMSRYLDDRQGLRQLVAIHLPGDFLDLHAFPLKVLEHDVATLTSATVATISHAQLEAITQDMPELTRKLWFATLLDAAIHRAWLFRLGRLDATGRIAHFLCETNARLFSAGLSDGRRFALALTQADLGEICGLTTVHVNRVMRQLREKGLCSFRASLVEIPDPVALAARGQFDPDYLYMETIPDFLSNVKRPRS